MKRRWARRGNIAMLLLAVACAYFFVKKEMTTAYILLGIIGAAVLSVIVAYIVILAKDGFLKVMYKDTKEEILDRIDTKKIKHEMRKMDLLDAKYELRVAPIEHEMDQLLAHIEARGEELSQNERDALLAQYEQLEKQLKEIEKEAEKEYKKHLGTE